MSQKSFDPELIDLDDLRSERSFDPEHAEAMANMSINSQKSFDPELLHFEPRYVCVCVCVCTYICYSGLGSAANEFLHFAPSTASVSSEMMAAEASSSSAGSYYPENASGKAQSVSSELSFDPENAAHTQRSVSSQLV